MNNRRFYATGLLMAASVFAFAQTDLEVQQADLTRCDTAGWVNMSMTVYNSGTTTIYASDSVEGTFVINGGAPETEMFYFSSDLASGDSATFTFTSPYLFNQFSTYFCSYYISYIGDANLTNDSVDFTSTFFVLPGFGAHSDDTAVCYGSPATLWMELTGNPPWFLTVALGSDTIYGLPVTDSILLAELTLDSTATFYLLYMTDINGCITTIGQGITITVNPYPEVYLGNDTTMCASGSILLDAGNPGATCQWWDLTNGQTFLADTSDWGGALGHQLAWVNVDLAGCVSSDTIDIEWIICPGGTDESGNPDFVISPNPTTGNIRIDLRGMDGSFNYQIVSTSGLIVKNGSFSDSPDQKVQCIDISGLSKGLYHLNVYNDETQIIQKLVIE